MFEREILMIPGPTNVDPKVLRALSKPTTSHTSQEFANIFKEALNNLKKVFMTKSEVFVIAGSGTLALEMAIANIVEPGDKVLNTVSGFFGNYFVEISKVYGAVPRVLEMPWGKPVKPEQVKDALMEDDYKAVTVTHVETSTGVANHVREIGEVVKRYSDAFYIVDTVCSLGGMEVRVDEWGIDACASGSQKCIGVPPGLALIAVSQKTLEYLEKRKTSVGSWYGSFKNWLPVMRDPTKYFATPPVNMVYALHEALKLIIEEGLENRFRRHYVLAEAFRAAVNALNLNLIAEKESAANTVTAAYYPENIEDSQFRNEMEKHGIVVASTLGPLKGKGFRVGHMGNVNQNDVFATVTAIETTLKKLGYKAELGKGLAAAQEKLLSLEQSTLA
ncbi:MAG: alanine--glyoxylate aminotransferase family protein [Candidatus Bathyarchaeota archaeon]|nr:alanine--glyoxylate aminotransferase family protein [Candidatus Bathyarchaeota archaeon]